MPVVMIGNSPMPAIEAKHLRHAYAAHFWSKPKEALRGLDLSVAEGEIFGYLGANGAGKTTTIKILVGLQTATGGSATLFGRAVTDPDSRRVLGFMPENPYFYEYLTARESLRFYAALCDMPRAERDRRAGELLEFVGLSEARDVRVKEFSKGMRQRLGIAQAIIHKPRLAIFDEPMSGLDPVGRRQVREAIRTLRRDGVTVFFSSHVLSDVEMLCDRVGLLAKGKLVACGPVASLLETKTPRVEVGAEGVPAALAAKLGSAALETAAQGAETVFVFSDRERAEDAMKAILAAGANVTLFRPMRETLEDYFMRTMGVPRAEVGAWSGGADR